MHGYLAAGNMDIECLGQYIDMGSCKQYNQLLNKFPKDQVFLDEGDQICFLDGYVYNKDAITVDGAKDWQHTFAQAVKVDAAKCLQTLRGGFCGYSYSKHNGRLMAYTDQVSVKALYYYMNENQWMVSNHIPYMIAVLRANNVAYHLDEMAAKYMLSYGYMLDNSTFVKEIHRLMPGQIVYIENGQAKTERYYVISNQEVQISEQEAVERIDRAFREAVRREFDKDKEYGYRHLVDLSGGLDSRMVSWVAHDMGYMDQLNFTYSRTNYHDERISKQIAAYLGHEYLFKPLEDLKWMFDLEEIVAQNNGAALYTGITGGRRMLSLLRMNQFGIEHTGMLGDVIIGTYHNKAIAHSKPIFGMNAYSDRIKYRFDENILKEYLNQEIFCIYTRGILGMESTYMIRQHYVETASPFMDVDFMDVVFSLPFEYRYNHSIYLKWIKEKYAKAAEFGWEKWGGIKPREDHIFLRKIKTTQRLLLQLGCRLLKIQNRDSMNPVDYWYQRNEKIQEYYRNYYDRSRKHSVLSEALKRDIDRMFEEGNVTDKSMALTVLAILNAYFEEEEE